MKVDEFIASVASCEQPPAELDERLQALWYAEKGEWEMSHTIAQGIETNDGCWIHAHLHRVEGDLGNARYWYDRAGQPPSEAPLEEERRAIIAAML